MGIEYPTLVGEDDRGDRDAALKAVRRVSPTTHRKKQLEPLTVLGQARASKAKHGTPEAQDPRIQAYHRRLGHPESSIPQAPKRR
jgi:hypothetical protein